tara:strand:+ start:1502 stop:1666 length:165 start_codon:yes stop_codon:yes gene_type:complete
MIRLKINNKNYSYPDKKKSRYPRAINMRPRSFLIRDNPLYRIPRLNVREDLVNV